MREYFIYKKFLFLKCYLNMDSDFTHYWTFKPKNATLFTKQKAVQYSLAYNLYYQSINN